MSICVVEKHGNGQKLMAENPNISVISKESLR